MEWISVKDKLPEGTDYFVFLNKNQGNIMNVAWISYVHNCYYESVKYWYGNIGNPHFTHWMPLPKPPKD